VLSVQESNPGELQALAIPWAPIKAALGQLQAATPALLRPGQPVSLEMEISPPHRDTAQTRRVLREAWSHRLAQEGIPLAGNQPTRVQVKLTEREGAKPEKARAIVEMAMVSAERPEPLWRGRLFLFPSPRGQREGNATTTWTSLLEHLTLQMRNLDLPYFIPRSADALTLPGVIE
jgi:hypothetical protein